MAVEVELSPEKKAALARFKGETIAEPEVKTAEQIEAEKKETERIAAQQEAERLRLEKEKTPNEPAPVLELTDEQLLAAIEKKSGRKITSWDELKPTPDVIDKEKAAELRESEKLSFGLKKGLFNKKQYEGFIADRQNPVGLVYAAELNEAKKNDPDWTDEKEQEFKDDFEAEFGLTLDPTSSKFKRGQKKIGIIAETILRNEYAPIFGLEGAYSKHESEQNTQKELQNKILTTAPIYKKDVEESLASLSKIDFSFGDEKYEVPVSKEIRDSIQEVLTDKDFVSSKIAEGYTKDEIGQIAHNMIISQNYATLAHEAAKLYRAKHEKGVRGIVEGGKLDNQGDGYEGLSENQKTALKFFQPEGSKAN